MIAEPKKYIENDEDIKSCISQSKSNDSLFSISSIESCSRSYDSLSELLSKSVESKNEFKYNTLDDTNIKKNVNGWIPLCKRKRRERDQTFENNLSKSPQVNDVIKLMTSFRLSPLSKNFISEKGIYLIPDNE
tara:strand:- start:9432 stop:9830 length:399 start_codon:yes stop_codon:yes gene_type:complete